MGRMGRHRRKTPRRARWEWTAPLCSAVLVSAAVTGSGWAVAELSGPPPGPPRAAATPPLVPVPPKPGPTIAPPTTTAAPTSEEVVPAEKAASPPAAPPKPAPPPPRACPTELAGTRPHVAAVGHHIAERFDFPLSRIGGRAPRPNNPTSDHPLGLALDFMVYDDRELGDRIAAYAVENADRFGITYVIWYREIWSDPGRGWRPYSGYSPHTDHPHISFEADARVDVTC